MPSNPDNDVTQTPGRQSTINGQPKQNPPDNPTVRGEEDDDAEETTPLLRRIAPPGPDLEQRTSLANSAHSWWTIISITVLLILTINIIIFAFLVPSAAQEYAQEAAIFSLRNIKIQEYTDSGVIANARVNITFDADRVSSNGIRRLGIAVSNIIKHVYTQPCDVSVRLPEYNATQVALVGLPALAVDIRNRRPNLLDVVTNVTITNETLAFRLAGDILAGNKKQVTIIGETDVRVTAGIIPLGKQHVKTEATIESLSRLERVY
jgi:hypothetical protein